MEIDTKKTYFVGFSGGKDSVATWLHLKRELDLPHVVCTFSDTGHEATDTYEYIDLLERDHGLRVVRIQPTLEDFRGQLKPEKIAARLGISEDDPNFWNTPLTMENLSLLKRRFPSSMVRFCTLYLKLIPHKRWMEANADLGNAVRVAGVRAEESPARALRAEWTEQDDMFGCPLWLPIHKWSHQEVFDIHRRFGVPPNPLYLQGMGRVGCFPCIMARKEELSAIAARRPDAFIALEEMEKRVAEGVGKPAMSFFSNGKTPKRFHSEVCQNSGKTFPVADDVRRWAAGEDPSSGSHVPMFEDDWTEDAQQCTSQYGLCE